MSAIYAVILAAFLGALGQLLFKKSSPSNLRSCLRPIFLLAILLYGISTVMFIVALKFEKLTILYPLISTSYIWTSILAIYFLGERMSIAKWIGIAFIILGVALIV